MNRILTFALVLLLGAASMQPLRCEAHSLPSDAAEPQKRSAARETFDYTMAAFNHDGCCVFQQWVIHHLTFSQGEFFDGQEVSALATFEVTKSGKVSKVEVKEPTSPRFEELLLKLLRTAPKWTPEVFAGKKAESGHSLSLRLKLHQNDGGVLYAEDILVYDEAEQMPAFEGGTPGTTLNRWITSRTGNTYPDGRYITENPRVKMIVEKDGSLSQVQVIGTDSEWLAQRIREVLAEAPRFTPAVHFGDAVRVRIGQRLQFPPAPSAAAQTGDDELPVLSVEVMPQFNGGTLNDFNRWVGLHLCYPQEAMELGIEGRVLITFVVEKDGSVSNIEVLKSSSELLSAAATATIAQSPKWEAGRDKDKPVRVRYTLPIDFRFN